MPTYGYECNNCGNGFEIVQKMADDPLTVCETCGGHLRKKVFPVGIVFKGSGFYVNDYASKKNGDESAAAKPDAKTTDTATVDSNAATAAPTESKSSESPAESKPAPAPVAPATATADTK